MLSFPVRRMFFNQNSIPYESQRHIVGKAAVVLRNAPELRRGSEGADTVKILQRHKLLYAREAIILSV